MKKYSSLITGIILISLFVLFVRSFNWTSSSSTELYFSDFMNLINRGEIDSVVIQKNEIIGTLINGQQFLTHAPEKSEYLKLLQEKKVKIEVKEADDNPWYLTLFLQWGPFLFLIAVWIYFLKKGSSGNAAGKLFSIGKSKATKAGDDEKKITFKDVAGSDSAKEELEEIIDFLKEPDRFRMIGAKIPKGVLMVGPPGTGKTLLAKAVAGEAEVDFFSISGSDFVEMFVGVGASRVRSLFEEGRSNAPCIIFIDEIDAVGRHRGAGLGGGHDEREQTLNQLLVEMDGFETSSGVIIIAATNRVDILDPALLRPGRFDRQVHINLPDIKSRKEILEVHCKGKKIQTDIDLMVIARGTPGFSGADLANLVNEGTLYAARIDKKEVDLTDLEWARDKVMMGAERKSLVMDDEDKRNTAYHEAGHALVAAHLENSDPIHKITIIPRGNALGLTSFLPEQDVVSMDKATLKTRITIAMGGRVAEELVLKDKLSGVEGDLKQSTQIAYNMVCKWGMSEKLGALTIDRPQGNFLAMDLNQGENVSDEILKQVDEEVKSILNHCYETAKTILSENIEKLHDLSKELLEKETIIAADLESVIGKITPRAI